MKKILLIAAMSIVFFGCRVSKQSQTSELKFTNNKNYVATIFNSRTEAVEALDRLLKQQYSHRFTHFYNGITEDRIERGNIHYYYNTMSSARHKYVRGLWIIIFESNKTGNSDYFRFLDKDMADEAFSSLKYLIENAHSE